MLQTLLILVVFAMFFPPTSQQCVKVNVSRCANVDFIPGSDLAGEGFDITKMEHKGTFVIDMSTWIKRDRSCTLCRNPYMRGKRQKLPVAVVNWRSRQKCRMKLSSYSYQSSEALVSASTSSIENDWKVGLDILIPKIQGSVMMAGTESKLAKYSMQKTKKDKYSFTSHSVSCGYYRYGVKKNPPLHPELRKEFRKLPNSYNRKTKHIYFNLIRKFGTHYIRQVTLGGEVRSVTSIKECQASLQGLSVDEVKMCLDMETTASKGPAANIQNKSYHCRQARQRRLNRRSFASSFRDRESTVIGGRTENVDLLFSSKTDPNAYKWWISSLPAQPDVISYKLEPLHKLQRKKKTIRENLRKAIKDYILQRALMKYCSSPCKIGVKTNSKEPCSCSCHNNPGVALNCCPTRRGYAQITVTVIRATGLYGDYWTQTDGYVKLFRNGNAFFGKTPVIMNRNSPTWNWYFSFENQNLNQFKSVKLEVWDQDSGWDDDLLGSCTVGLRSGVIRNACALNHGVLYYKVQVKCLPALSGSMCREYMPSPMDAQLENEYVSRNARPIPRSMLLEMGVLLDERIPRFNQSNIHKAVGFEL
ncbi:perforin-1-like [Clarias gariepinus]|uniref:perforin-1-like n=1 Tax=Clarias gariepinus TaxID=13013 RepID=UPI00234C3A0E|nr:perforin-1-like [Clarias gariepinus]